MLALFKRFKIFSQAINQEIELISPNMLHSILSLKNNYLNIKNPLLDIDEVLLTLTIASSDEPNARNV